MRNLFENTFNFQIRIYIYL